METSQLVQQFLRHGESQLTVDGYRLALQTCQRLEHTSHIRVYDPFGRPVDEFHGQEIDDLGRAFRYMRAMERDLEVAKVLSCVKLLQPSDQE